MEIEELIKAAEDKVNLGKELIQKLEIIQHIDGVQKIQRKIQQELKFLEKVNRNNTPTKVF